MCVKNAERRPCHIRAPAKINLHLAVTGRRSDGYHEIVSLMAAVSLYDELWLDPEAAAPGRLRLAGEPRQALVQQRFDVRHLEALRNGRVARDRAFEEARQLQGVERAARPISQRGTSHASGARNR